jgi:hypothetical protein
MDRKNHMTRIALVLALISTIWIYTARNHHEDITTVSKISKDIIDRKSNEKKVVSSDNNETYKRRSYICLTGAESDFIDDIPRAVYPEDGDAVERELDGLDDCDDCIDQLIIILNDPSYDKDFRKHAVLALLESGTKEGLMAIVNFITTTEQKERDRLDPMRLLAEAGSFEEDWEGQSDHIMRDAIMRMFYEGDSLSSVQGESDNLDLRIEIMSMLAEVDYPGDVVVLVDLLTGTEENVNNGLSISIELRRVLVKAIRNVSDQETAGALLAERYRSAISQKVKSQLIGIDYPAMNAFLASEAYKQGDDDEAFRFTRQLESIGDVRVIDWIMFLTLEGNAPVGDAADMLYQWTRQYPDESHYDIISQYLNDVVRTPEERAVSAYALSAMTDNNQAINALEEAYYYESDPLVLDYIEFAFDEIDRKVEEGEI